MTDLSTDDLAGVRARLVGSRDLFSISELYHENSKITPSTCRFVQGAASMLAAPDGFKRYLHAPQVNLPAPGADRPCSLREAILGRRSCRAYSGGAIALGALADLVYYAAGTPDRGSRRCLPSAGGLYPLELYVAASHVDGLEPGLYHYDVRSHRLSQLSQGDCRSILLGAIFIEQAVEGAAAVLILSGVFGRSKIKYGERAYRFVLLEAGHAMQNVCLAATALGLGLCPVGGFIDDKINDLLDIDGIEEAALYAATVGAPA